MIEYFPFSVYKTANFPPRFIPGYKGQGLSPRADNITQCAGNKLNYTQS